MSLKNIKPDELKRLFQQNIPLMDVRAQVGTVYKNQGNEAAVKLGQELIAVSGPTGSGKTHFLRGLKDHPVIDLEALARHRGSAFGSWEVEQPSQSDYENTLARQILLLEDKIQEKIKPLVEDESRLIGRISQPATFFIRLRSSPVIWIDEPLDVRVDNVFDDYILNSSIGQSLAAVPRCAEENDILRGQALKLFARYRQSLLAIQRKLGGLRAQEVMADLEKAELAYLNHAELSENKVWIEKLLQYYYDPMYLGSLDRRHVTVLFKGTRIEAEKFVHSLR